MKYLPPSFALMKNLPPNFALMKNLPPNFVLLYKDVTKQWDVVNSSLYIAFDDIMTYILNMYTLFYTVCIYIC